MKRILLEVCIASVDDAVLAAAAGADRLELNAALPLGGLTPSLGTLIEVKRAVALPVLVMLRPRPGGFCYSDSDFLTLRRDLDLALEHGANAVVFGVLKEDGRVDVERCHHLVSQAGQTPCVFHRAFDVVPEPAAALEQLIDLGFCRVMSSGQEAAALHGSALLRQLIETAGQRIEVLPAGGIRATNVRDVVSRTGCTQVHASLRHRLPDSSTRHRPALRFGGALPETEDEFEQTRPESVRELRTLLDSLP